MNKALICIIPFVFLTSCNKDANIKDYTGRSVKYERTQEELSDLEIKPQKIEFGDVKKEKGKHIKKTVDFYNKGNKPIVIQKVDVSCSCMKTKLSENVISPKKTVKMEVDINPENKTGYFSKAIFVKSTASSHPDLIRIKANFIN